MTVAELAAILATLDGGASIEFYDAAFVTEHVPIRGYTVHQASPTRRQRLTLTHAAGERKPRGPKPKGAA